MEEDKIVLDRKSFEALAVDTRIKILKSLKERRKTLSEIAKEQDMSVSGVKEHLETLEGVGLIVKKDDGHKWKYYELTKKGSGIVAPKELRVWILLSISTIALLASVLALTSVPGISQDGFGGAQMFATASDTNLLSGAAPNALKPAPMLGKSSEPAPDNSEESYNARNVAQDENPGAGERMMAVAEISETGAAVAETPGDGKPPDITMPAAVLVISVVTLAACVGILLRNRLKPGSL